LGFRFAPRFRDLPDQTLYRARKGVDYGVLAPTLKKDIRFNLIMEHWDDLNRIAASLKDGLIRPSILVSKLQSMQQQNPLQQALQELGRVAKTLYILEYVDDPLLRRRVLIGLNKGEHLHSLARDIAFGRQGRFHDRGYEAQLNRCKIQEETQQESGLKSSITEVYSTVSKTLWRQRGCYVIWNGQPFTT
jgi:TnpA family transposase